MTTQQFTAKNGLWECAGCHVRFSTNEDGATFLAHHGKCPEVGAMTRAGRARIVSEVTAMRDTARNLAHESGDYWVAMGFAAQDEALTAALAVISGE